jgi:branched-chain amino acid transport system permease protein
VTTGTRPIPARRLTIAIGVLAVAAALPLVAGPHLLTALIVALHAAYMALAWNVAAGYAGQFSLGHSLFFGIGAYTSTMLYVKLGLTPWAGMFAGALLAGLTGLLLALGVYRYNVRGIFFALVTLGAAEVAKGLADNWSFIKGPVGILLTMKHAPAEFFFLQRAPYYYVALAMVVGLVVVSLVLERSRLGQYFLAVREDEQAAEASGVHTYRAKTIAIAASAALTALAGSYYAQFYLYVSPETVLVFEPQMTMMLGTMVGGAGTALGPVLGSLLFSGLGEALRNLPFENTRQVVIGSKMVYAVLLVVVLLYLPGGLITLGRRRPAA